ncbi:MFS transporter [Vibrio panuliri]|uniref:Major facilitator superfamily (MFS) profile domain-containing protein n=1 Tax=Vibrio panuliri TaxID=1381081 RepID=A0A1Q9HP29_9VIBR|nr:MFS transporter [Vibrio panuliri]KAB1455169.1 MFS transporter [Vibrio panuliri]OLQ91839.1 hypothetical protein BIY20_09465 [Vibrio panuliri]OLQ92605.1 hypothetical protein BIY22_14850 [Vibrio panuliri]
MSKLNVWTLLIGLACVGAGQSVLFSVLPPLGRDIGLADHQVALIFTLAAIAFMASAPFWGRKSDEWGRKRLIVLGFFGYAISMAVFAVFGDLGRFGLLSVTVTFWLLTLSRLAYALLSSGVFPAVQAAMAESSPIEKRASAMASIQAAFGLGMIAGPAIAAVLVVVSITLPLYVSAAVSLVAASLVLLVMPNNAPSQTVTTTKSKLRVTDVRIRIYLLIGFVFFVAFAGLMQLTAFRYQDLFSLTAEQAAAETSIGFLCSAIATLLIQVLVIRRFSPHAFTQLLFGLLFGATAFGLLVFPSASWQMHILFALFGCSMGLVSTGFNTAVTLAVNEHELGAASGLAAGAQAGGYIVGPLLATSLYHLNTDLPFACFALVLAVCGGFLLLRKNQIYLETSPQ